MTSPAAPHAASAWAQQIEAHAAVVSSALPAPASIGPATSGPFYARLAALAVRMLPKYATGSVSIVKRTEGETGNPLKPYEDATESYPRHAYVSGYPSDRIDGESVLATDLRVIFAAQGLPLAPTAKDALKVDGAPLAIVQVAAVPAAGQVALYIVQARAA
jgi:hypothetical protein